MSIDDRLRDAAKGIDESVARVEFEARLDRLLAGRRRHVDRHPARYLAASGLTVSPAALLARAEDIYNKQQPKRRSRLRALVILLGAAVLSGIVIGAIAVLFALGHPIVRNAVKELANVLYSTAVTPEWAHLVAEVMQAIRAMVDTAVGLLAATALIAPLIMVVRYQIRKILVLGGQVREWLYEGGK